MWPRSESPARIIPPRNDLSLLPATSPPGSGSPHEFIQPSQGPRSKTPARTMCDRSSASGALQGQRLSWPTLPSTTRKTLRAPVPGCPPPPPPQPRGRYRVHNCYFSGPHGQRRKRKRTLRADSTGRQETRMQKKETGQRTTRGKAGRKAPDWLRTGAGDNCAVRSNLRPRAARTRRGRRPHCPPCFGTPSRFVAHV